MESEPTYTVFIRLPFPRGDFVDPPPVSIAKSRLMPTNFTSIIFISAMGFMRHSCFQIASTNKFTQLSPQR